MRIGITMPMGKHPLRTYLTTAKAAADVDDLPDGRLPLGLGMGIPGLMATLHGAPIDRPLARMREYAQALRSSRDYLAGEFGDGPDMITQVVCRVHPDRETAMRPARIHVGQLARWKGVIDHVMLPPGYVPPLTSEETADAYQQVLDAFRRSPAGEGAAR